MAKKTNINDLYVKFENLTKEARSLNDEGKNEDAKAKIEEARSIKTQIDNYEAINGLEEVEEREIKMPKDKKTLAFVIRRTYRIVVDSSHRDVAQPGSAFAWG